MLPYLCLGGYLVHKIMVENSFRSCNFFVPLWYFYLSSLIQVVESPCDAALIPDGAALSAYQYFENVRNFLVAVQELGIPNFEASDLEQVGAVAT